MAGSITVRAFIQIAGQVRRITEWSWLESIPPAGWLRTRGDSPGESRGIFVSAGLRLTRRVMFAGGRRILCCEMNLIIDVNLIFIFGLYYKVEFD